MKDLLFILHDKHATTGTTEKWCKSRGLSCESVQAADFLSSPPDLSNWKALVLFGGGVQVWQEAQYPWLTIEKTLLQAAIAREQKIVGLCLGAQLLAEQLGAEVKKMDGWEVGWYPVKLEGTEKPLMPLHWHCSDFTLPSGAKRLATNEKSANQAFAFGPNILALQFHAEIDQPRLAHALEQWKDSHPGKIQPKNEIRDLASTYMQPLEEWFFSVLDEWWEK